MASGMFKGPKGALIFMGMTLLSVIILVGTEDDEGALVTAADELSQDREQFEAATSNQAPETNRELPPARSVPGPTIEMDEFVAEDEFIDDTTGFDPSPIIEAPFDNGQPSSDVVIVDNYGQTGPN